MKVKQALIIYAFLTGNNERIANEIARQLKNNMIETSLLEADEVSLSQIQNNDILIVCIYTYDFGCLPYEVEKLYNEFDNIDLDSKIVGVCGSGDLFYEDFFCKAVDLFEVKMRDQGALIASESLKIHLAPNRNDFERVANFTKEIISQL